jgi:alpha-galactosidase
MSAAGYNYVNSDSGWQGGRHPNGTQFSHPVAFPHGMKWLAAYVHDRGLRLGLYANPATSDCAYHRPETMVDPPPYEASLYLEDMDAATYAAWGIDSVHYDNCGEMTVDYIAKASPMRDALNRSGHLVMFMASPWYLDPYDDVRWLRVPPTAHTEHYDT